MPPFVSDQQRKYLYAVHPKIAAEFAEHTPKGVTLPKYAHGAPASKKTKERK